MTSKSWRLSYEVEAYKVWLAIAPQDRAKVVWLLTHSYGAGLPQHEVIAILDSPPSS